MNHKKFCFTRFVAFLFMFSLSACIISETFLRNYNNQLSRQIQSISNSVDTLVRDNDAKEKEISMLTDTNRITAMAPDMHVSNDISVINDK